jgi:hypothetical protein
MLFVRDYNAAHTSHQARAQGVAAQQARVRAIRACCWHCGASARI